MSSIFELSLGAGGNGGNGGKGGAGGQGGAGGTGGQGGSGGKGALWRWISNAVPALGNALLLVGLGLLAISLALVPFGWLIGQLLRWRRLWRSALFRWLPALRIQPFNDKALSTELGAAFALLTQARVGGGREGGAHLYLVTGEQPAGDALADLQGVPQAQPLAAAIALLRLTWKRRRLIVDGALMPVEGKEAVAVALSLRRNSRLIATAEFWPSQPPTEHMTATSSNSVLAVAAAGWIEHRVVDETPGLPAREVFLSHDARSWALFRAGAELNRISYIDDAADYYEKALAIDDENVGALVDLAHLRRRAGYFEGAHALARRAVKLIEERNHTYRCSNDDDPNWYRALLVKASVEASWAKDLTSPEEGEKAGALRSEAFGRMRSLALEAMASQKRLESIAGGSEPLEDAARGAQVGRSAQRAMRQRARDMGRSFDLARATELYAVLETTFEPGALVLVASNFPNEDGLMAPEAPDDRAEVPGDATRDEIATAREKVKRELEGTNEFNPATHIDYVSKLQHTSPRVVYNLACYYSLAAAVDTQRRGEHLKRGFEFLRQSISRTPPLERRGLLEHARVDPDLLAVRHARWQDFRRLWELIPRVDTQAAH